MRHGHAPVQTAAQPPQHTRPRDGLRAAARRSQLTRPLAELPRRHEELASERPVLVHCASGWRSSVAASLLRSTGHADVTDLVGGYAAWAQREDVLV
ncbi:rhodanese-like domain-containing protein [Janibacter limosus]|uniref:Rhodanese-like domain-containing protein n=1 Tax=Janibacter limosus TaxID=53458 RepID=A0A4P6MY42_9MICO|nr:rhodanese-like domain-containing protein [Janibacter limosus]